jgi:POT family proton-dependent oligopeptide transporter
MTLGLVIYLVATPHLPSDAFVRRVPNGGLDGSAWRSIIALFLLFVPVSLFWATYEQQGNTITLWADQFTDRHFVGSEIPVTWFQAFNPFMIFAFTPFIVAFWRRQEKNEPSTIAKLAIGCAINAFAYLVMVAAAWIAGGEKASWFWLFVFFVIITVGELYLSPTSLSLVTKIAPRSLLSMMMGVWLATSFVGGFLAGYLGTFWSTMDKSNFFLMLALISLASGIAIALLRVPLRSVLRD